MLTLSSTQVNQINALLRTLKISNTTNSHPDWPIWTVVTQLFDKINKQQTQLKNQDATIRQLQIDIERCNQQITNVARNAAVSRKSIL